MSDRPISIDAMRSIDLPIKAFQLNPICMIADIMMNDSIDSNRFAIEDHFHSYALIFKFVLFWRPLPQKAPKQSKCFGFFLLLYTIICMYVHIYLLNTMCKEMITLKNVSFTACR